MADSLMLHGAAAEICWGYLPAASLGPWTVSGTPGAWTFTAAIKSKNDFRLSQQPLEVVTPNGWRWAMDPHSLQVVNGTLTASVRHWK
jgi:hypothetical protein